MQNPIGETELPEFESIKDALAATRQAMKSPTVSLDGSLRAMQIFVERGVMDEQTRLLLNELLKSAKYALGNIEQVIQFITTYLDKD